MKKVIVRKKSLLIGLIISVITLCLLGGGYIYLSQLESSEISGNNQKTLNFDVASFERIESILEEVMVNDTVEIDLPANYDLISDEFDFIKVDSGKLIISPTKYNSGEYEILLAEPGKKYSKPFVVSLYVQFPEVDLEGLEKEILGILGNREERFGIYVGDLLREDTVLQINGGEVFLPGSIAKVPVVILALRDIDSGKISFDDTHIVKNELKHTSWDAIGRLPAGSKVSVRTLIYETIHTSNNSAMYHLRDFLGGILEVDARTRSELGVNTFMDAPSHAVIARNAGKVFTDVYNNETLSKESADYFIDLLKNVVPSLRDGIPQGTPDEATAATKVGFLYGKGLNAYGDAGYVFGKTTDYVLVVVDKETSVSEGRAVVNEIAEVVYRYLN